ncbi:MAG: DNRLRE domain-containing protein [Candidatus Omnitrophota bacterium]
MKNKILSALIILGVFGLVAILPANASTTYTFQNGLNGYSGTQDNSIRGVNSKKEYNYGTNQRLYLRAGTYVSHILLYFDISSLPSNMCILSSTLKLYKLETTSDPTSYIYQITAGPWSEGTKGGDPATAGDSDWNHRIHDTASWAAPGMLAGTDYDATAADVVPLGANGWYEWNVTSIVQDWYNNVDPNYGFVIKLVDNNWDEQKFASSEHDTLAWRPKLIVQCEACQQNNVIPEPATVSLFAIGLLGLFRPRRKK